MAEADQWKSELGHVFARVAGRFARADLRRRMRDYVRGLPAPVGRKNGWQPAEWAGHRDPAGLQHLLNGARWDADVVGDDVRDHIAERLGPGGVLIIDDTGFLKKGTTSAGVQQKARHELVRVRAHRGLDILAQHFPPRTSPVNWSPSPMGPSFTGPWDNRALDIGPHDRALTAEAVARITAPADAAGFPSRWDGPSCRTPGPGPVPARHG
ncbi:transposase [Streptomyces sp. NPDC006134]|uniref:transposase n=1 Tax=Streptomyces sp. NPDC006134 TaxID=3154467 RepID=UPI00340DDD93